MDYYQSLLAVLSNYFSADTPELRSKALADLVKVYRQAKANPEPEHVGLPLADIAKLQALVHRTGDDSVEALLSTVVNTPKLLKYIGDYLSSPIVEPPTGLPEIIIRPEKPVCLSIARIGMRRESVTVLLPEKRNDFRDVVKGLGYDWNGDLWGKKSAGIGKAANAAAELGSHLLANGFWIAPPTPQVRDLIVEESFEPEHRRKVMARISGQYAGWFALWWTRSEDCYQAAKRISGSRYDKSVVVAPPEIYDEVEDFAEQHGFYITPAAMDLIANAKAAMDAALLLKVELEESGDPDSKTPPKLDITQDIGIDDDLADND